jgi:hypothetical protein
MQAGDVKMQMADTVAILGLRRRQHPLGRVIAEVGIGDHQVRVVCVCRHLGHMVPEDSRAFAHRHDDPELPIGVVVGHHVHAPEKEIIRAPSEAAVHLVFHDRGERRRIYLAGHERFVGRESPFDRVVKPIVPFLTEMETENYQEPYGERGRAGDCELLWRHRSIFHYGTSQEKRWLDPARVPVPTGAKLKARRADAASARAARRPPPVRPAERWRALCRRRWWPLRRQPPVPRGSVRRPRPVAETRP